jgi:hypothetical protein
MWKKAMNSSHCSGNTKYQHQGELVEVVAENEMKTDVSEYRDSTGQILLVFYEIYRVGDRAHCRINFVWKRILVCVF